jgi:hypothetical protein
MTHVTPYDRLAFSAEEAEHLLATGEHERDLIAYFGAEEHAELARLAREAQRRRKRRPSGDRVYVLPGVMGSQLGLRRARPLPPDILWLDPLDIAIGRLLELRWFEGSAVVAFGVMLYNYLRLKMLLERAGFDVLLHDYDWRDGVDRLGAQLATRIRADERARVHIVAHSMGGLVARAALLAPDMQKVTRLVMLGTPNLGSYAPLQALRGVYPVVRRIAALDLRHSAEELAGRVFAGFPSLYHMLPMGPQPQAPDLLDPSFWPATGPQPDASLLSAARGLEQRLAPADQRFSAIVGIAQDTVTAARREGDELHYTVTRNGDGTVPAALAALPGASNYYVDIAHGDLPRSARVTSAVIELLRKGETARLSRDWSPLRAPALEVADAQLRATHREKIDWAALEPEERRQYLEHLNDPPEFARTQPPTAAPARLRGAPRRAPSAASAAGEPTRLEIVIERGDITRARAAALVVAVFSGVPPAGAAGAIDAKIGGVIGQFAARRMISGETGAVVAIPEVRGLEHARTVLIAGLGRFDRLDDDAIELAARNVMRWCAHSSIRELATVPWGAGAGFAAERSFAAQLCGYAGSLPADGDGAWRIVFCVRRQRELTRVVAQARRLLAAPQGPRVTLVVRDTAGARERRQRAKRPSGPKRASRELPLTVAPQIAHLLVNDQQAPRGKLAWRAALLTAGRQAAVISEVCTFEAERLERELRGLDALTTASLADAGKRLGELVLHPSVRRALHADRDHPLALVHDDAGSRVPWEILNIQQWHPAANAGMSRRYAAEDLPVARFSEKRRNEQRLNVLLVVNPTADLPGADLERERVAKLLANLPQARLTVVEGRAATRARVQAELQSGAYDLLHYAGHAFFDARAPERSGVRCSDGVLTGADLNALAQLPALMVFNACESGRVRRGAAARSRSRRAAPARRALGLRAHTGLAEACLRGGVAHFVGTYWPVGDAAALAFAETLYERLVAGAAIGEAVLEGRRAVRSLRSVDWANYIHYGDPQFRLKLGP